MTKLADRVIQEARFCGFPVTPRVRAFIYALSEDYLRTTLELAHNALEKILDDVQQ